MAKPGSKIFHDPIHGPMEFDSVLVKIIDTPEFQRLRRIKQLGGGCYVYPGATHTRFEHSLGVCHLAGMFAEHLKDTLEEGAPEITSVDIKCIKVAGLCHDLGHGPFSHMFQDFANRILDTKWKHEDMSVKILNKVLDDVNDPELNKEGSRKFIAELIKGVENYTGQRHFLYQIVANKDNGIDVDKWDYFARDCHYLGLFNDFQWMRCMMLARVKNVSGSDYQICYRDNAIANICAMFRTRSTLHQKAYQHPRIKAAEHMMIDCLLHMVGCNYKPHGLKKNLKEILESEDVEEYVKLDDSIVESLQKSEAETEEKVAIMKKTLRGILAQRDIPEFDESMVQFLQEPVEAEEKREKMNEATGLIDRLRKRQLYPYLGFAKSKLKKSLTQEAVRNLQREHAAISVVEVNFGSERDNPLGKLWFYLKNQDHVIKLDPQKANKIQLGGLLLPLEFTECEVRFYCRVETTTCSPCEKAIEQFLKTQLDTFGAFIGHEGYFSMTEGKKFKTREED